MREVVLITQPLSKPEVDTPALFELDPAMGSGGHSAQLVLRVSDPALLEDASLARGQGHAGGDAQGLFQPVPPKRYSRQPLDLLL